MDEKSVKQVEERGAQEKWSYPQYFQALKDVGVERYETNVLEYSIKYVGGKSSFTKPAPPDFKPLIKGPSFNVDGIKNAVGRIGRGETTYAQFLEELAAAGVPFYRVDMGPRTVTYHGSSPKEKYVEHVPK